MLNKIFLMGRLTKDPELRRTQSGTAVASFSIAVDRDHGKKGEDKAIGVMEQMAHYKATGSVDAMQRRIR